MLGALFEGKMFKSTRLVPRIPLALSRSCFSNPQARRLPQFVDPLNDRGSQLGNDGNRRISVKLRLRHAVIAGGRAENVVGGGNQHQLRGGLRRFESARIRFTDLNVPSL